MQAAIEQQLEGVVSDLASGWSVADVITWQGALIQADDMYDMSQREVAEMLMKGIPAMTVDLALFYITEARLCIFLQEDGTYESGDDESSLTEAQVVAAVVAYLTEQLLGNEEGEEE